MTDLLWLNSIFAFNKGNSQATTKPSQAAVRTELPLGVNMAFFTNEVCPSKLFINFPAATSQIIAVLSYEEEIRYFPSGLKFTEITPFVCPVNSLISSPLFLFHSFIVLSEQAVAKKFPSGLQAIELGVVE